MSAIWQAIRGERVIRPIGGHGFRLVECQETVATTEIVSTLERQVILEALLDAQSKPGYQSGTEQLYYLLSTPFRYPPLLHGSRFGGRFESSLFYAGCSKQVTLSEAAYYRFFFYQDMDILPPSRQLRSQHTLFGFKYQTGSGLQLQATPFDPYVGSLRDPADYSVTQALGAAMRAAGVKAFEYPSARDPAARINVALYDASAFASNKPEHQQSCLCQTTDQDVVFSLDRQTIHFGIETFLVNGKLPIPAD